MLEIGSIIDGKYKILNVIGKGGMSIVYLAMNERANKQWAIKEVRKDGMQNFEVVKQNLIAETDMLKRFNHPNLPSIIDVIEGEGTFLIVMDYIEGISLGKALEREGAQKQNDVIEWSKQLCDVLGYLHSRNPPIIYRDMKPSNVMLRPDGNVMLIDFGTAREFKSNSVADTTCLGTQGYAAPEQFGGQGQTDARTDIYCLGATMYHLVTGHNPCTPPYEMYPIRQWNPMLSSGLEEIIIKCTQKNPNDRYQSCAELLYALDHYSDLDIENKKVQNLKWKTFLTTSILTVVMVIVSVIINFALSAQISSTYNSLLEQAVAVEDSDKDYERDKKVSLYKSAIEVEPSRPEAYENLFHYFVGYSEGSYDESIIKENSGDDSLSIEEKQALTDIMNEYGEYFEQENPQEFAEMFAYPYALSLYSTYGNGKEGKQASAKWFEKAEPYLTDSKQQERCGRLHDMAKKYADISTLNAESDSNGDPKVGYQDYWNSLCELAEDDLDEKENVKIALDIYKFVANQMKEYSTNFLQAGVDYNTYESEIERIEKNINEIKQNPFYKKSNDYENGVKELGEICSAAKERAEKYLNNNPTDDSTDSTDST